MFGSLDRDSPNFRILPLSVVRLILNPFAALLEPPITQSVSLMAFRMMGLRLRKRLRYLLGGMEAL
jgi:hypothetical protein